MPGSRGWTGGSSPPPPPPPPAEKSQNYRVSLKYWTGPPEKPQSCYRARIQWVINGTPVKRHLRGVSLTGRCRAADSGIWILPPFIKKKQKKKQKKNVVQVGPPLIKLSGSAHGLLVILKVVCSATKTSPLYISRGVRL